VDFAEEEVDDDGEDPKEEVVDDIIVCLFAFVRHGGRKVSSRRAFSIGVSLTCTCEDPGGVGWKMLGAQTASECRCAARMCANAE